VLGVFKATENKVGYTTEFKGFLKFKKELTASQLAYVNQFLGEDVRQHNAWKEKTDDMLGYIDLRLTDSFDGIQWDGSEKSYYMEKQVAFILKMMRRKYPDFELVGAMYAQGEEVGDVWKLVIVDGVPTKVPLEVEGDIVECPCCEEEFVVNYPPLKWRACRKLQAPC